VNLRVMMNRLVSAALATFTVLLVGSPALSQQVLPPAQINSAGNVRLGPVLLGQRNGTALKMRSDESDLTLSTRPLFEAANSPASIDFVARQMSYITAFASPQAAIDASARTGRNVVVPAGYTLSLTAPLLMKSGVCLRGEENVPDTGVGLIGSTIRAAVPMASLITQADLTFSVRNACIRGLTLNASTNVTGAAVDVAMISSHITDNTLQGPGYTSATTGIRQRTPSGGFGWINYVSRNRVGGFGTGVDYNGSDSWVTENYLSGNRVDVILNSTGAIVFSGNQVENSGGPDASGNYTGVGLRLINTATGANDKFASFLVTGNNFISHGTAIEIPDAPVAGFRSSHTIAANNFNDARKRAISIGANNTQGSIWVNTFAEVAASGDGAIVWSTTGTKGWKVGPNSFSGTFNPTPVKYVNMPGDTILIDDVLKNRQVIVDNGAFGYSSTAPLAAYGNATELGASNVVARFGLAQNAAGFDAAFLVRSLTGTTPALDCRDGEQTQIGGCVIMMNGQERLRFFRTGGVGVVNMPTSPTGLPSGGLWRDAANENVVKVVP